MEGRVVALTALALLLVAAQLQAAPLFSEDLKGLNTNTRCSIASGPALDSCSNDLSFGLDGFTGPKFTNFATALGNDATEINANQTSDSDDSSSFVPEPVALAALAVGLVSLGGVIRRCKQTSPVFFSSW